MSRGVGWPRSSRLDGRRADCTNQAQTSATRQTRRARSPRHDVPDPGAKVISDRTANILIGVVTTLWAGNLIMGMAQVNDYQPSESLNGIFMGIVGGAFALRAKSKNDEPDDGDDDPPDKPQRKKPKK